MRRLALLALLHTTGRAGPPLRLDAGDGRAHQRLDPERARSWQQRVRAPCIVRRLHRRHGRRRTSAAARPARCSEEAYRRRASRRPLCGNGTTDVPRRHRGRDAPRGRPARLRDRRGDGRRGVAPARAGLVLRRRRRAPRYPRVRGIVRVWKKTRLVGETGARQRAPKGHPTRAVPMGHGAALCPCCAA